MLPRSDISVTPVGRLDGAARLAPVADPRQEAFARSLSSMVGTQLQGAILARLKDGSFLVKVGDTAARMQLPPGAEAGKSVPMTLLTLTPRPTFQVEVQGQPGQMAQFEAEAPPAGAAAPYLDGADEGALAARTQGGAGLAQTRAVAPSSAELAAAAPQVPGAAAAPVTLSETARVLSNVLSLAMAQSQGDTIVAKTALSTHAGAPPAQLAAALQDAVGKSGLFYESHVAEWSNGQRSLADLGQEPQMQRPGAATDPASAQLINLQLQTQEHARVAWQGQVWPGQDMHWEIQRDESEGGNKHGGEEAPEPGWHSALKLRFPMLGEIGARLVLRGDQLQLQLDAAGDAGPLLRTHAARLEAAMQAAGTPLSSLTIGTPRSAADSHE
ncbi:flagellar hook-length control protein FliK [Massilia sp. CF038]|uniref:flagellar hook-length control protein FliK n=1 Tax=Massilia sp. CF038 TaxID=1881045 RepID=UPI00091E5D55|nr:flagellar hook-length control protein FliK [Massilia sp. CF038]SHG44873.1 hook-length control protein FliK [Massilia sp. CF038]